MYIKSQRSRVRIPLRAVQLFSLKLAVCLYLPCLNCIYKMYLVNVHNPLHHQVRQKLDRLKEEHLHLNQQMTMYSAAGSTPGSTPSSSVININDVGQLPVELHVPHINEPDAISARATVSVHPASGTLLVAASGTLLVAPC